MQDGPNGFEARWSDSEREQLRRELHGFAHGDTAATDSTRNEISNYKPEWAGENRHERRKAAKQARRSAA